MAMIRISDIINEIEALAPLLLQEGFDNAGVQVGDVSRAATGGLLCLDVTEAVVDEAIEKGCNLIISHHPLAFKPFKSLTGHTSIERCMIKACKSDLVIYAAHTNLDNAYGGVNYRLAEIIGLQDVRILSPHENPLLKLDMVGSGIVGDLPESEEAPGFLLRIKNLFQAACVKHSVLTGQPIRRVAVCGGSGAFLIPEAIASGADVFITGEARYNDFYDVEDKILLAVIGHYETEICTKDIFYTLISKKFPTFALHFSNVNSNPVNYL
jgi:dinuclear metal center YbgI/SA1388 family protein